MAEAPGALRKTVAIFAALTKRKLHLEDGPTPTTDGTALTIPYADPHAYTLLEQCLSHVVFDGDAGRRSAFIEEFVRRAEALAARHDKQVDGAKVAVVLGDFFDVVEAHRVRSLWARLYAGSAGRICEYNTAVAAESQAALNEGIQGCFVLAAHGLPIGNEQYAPYAPLFMEALRKVRGRGPKATMLTSRWLVSALLNEIVRSNLNLDPPEKSQGGSNNPSGTGEGSPDEPNENTQPTEGEPPPWYPPPIQSTPREKLDALNKLSQRMASKLPDRVSDALQPSKKSTFSTADQEQRHRREAQGASSTNTTDPAAMEQELQGSGAEMDARIDEMERALQEQSSESDWITKDTPDRVRFVDVAPTQDRTVLSTEGDEAAAKKLRAVFLRVKGRVEYALEDSGSEVDMDAAIAQRITRAAAPIFRHETMGRGFKAVLLLDRSGTMIGERTAHALRAYRVLSAALNFSFVDLSVWGFNALTPGEVSIYRYPRNALGFGAQVEGFSPLHVAIDMAARALRRGSEYKVLLPLTDGFPEYINAEGQPYGRQQLTEAVRASVLQARASGVHVLSAVIGDLERARVWDARTGAERLEDEADAEVTSSVSHAELVRMFGADWTLIDPRRVGDSLIDLVSRTFVRFLKGR